MYKQNPHPEILCFRAFDMRDHFPQPVETFRDALELLQSDRAYLPEESAQIACYLKNGVSIQIPDRFYWNEVPRFQNDDDARKWVLERMGEIQRGVSLPIIGLVITDSKLPVEDQVQEALGYSDTEVIDPSENDRVCAEVHNWLNAAVSAMPGNKTDEGKAKRLMHLRIYLLQIQSARIQMIVMTRVSILYTRVRKTMTYSIL